MHVNKKVRKRKTQGKNLPQHGLLTKREVSFFFALFIGRDEVEAWAPGWSHLKRKKEQGQYSAILTEQTWSIKANRGFIMSPKRKRLLSRPRREIQSEKDGPILPSPVANQNAGFSSSCPLADSAMYLIKTHLSRHNKKPLVLLIILTH